MHSESLRSLFCLIKISSIELLGESEDYESMTYQFSLYKGLQKFSSSQKFILQRQEKKEQALTGKGSEMTFLLKQTCNRKTNLYTLNFQKTQESGKQNQVIDKFLIVGDDLLRKYERDGLSVVVLQMKMKGFTVGSHIFVGKDRYHLEKIVKEWRNGENPEVSGRGGKSEEKTRSEGSGDERWNSPAGGGKKKTITIKIKKSREMGGKAQICEVEETEYEDPFNSEESRSLNSLEGKKNPRTIQITQYSHNLKMFIFLLASLLLIYSIMHPSRKIQ